MYFEAIVVLAMIVGFPLLALFVFREKSFRVLAFGVSAMTILIYVGTTVFDGGRQFAGFMVAFILGFFGLALYFTLREESEENIRRKKEYKESDEYKLQEALQAVRAVRKKLSDIDERLEKARQKKATVDGPSKEGDVEDHTDIGLSYRRNREDPLGIDQLFAKLTMAEIATYQSFFDQVIDAVDLPTQTAWSQAQNYDRAQMDRDEEIMESIIANQAVKAGVEPMLLQIIVNQYFFADVYMRERDREDWVNRVIRRKDADYFPAATNVYRLLNSMR